MEAVEDTTTPKLVVLVVLAVVLLTPNHRLPLLQLVKVLLVLGFQLLVETTAVVVAVRVRLDKPETVGMVLLRP